MNRSTKRVRNTENAIPVKKRKETTKSATKEMTKEQTKEAIIDTTKEQPIEQTTNTQKNPPTEQLCTQQSSNENVFKRPIKRQPKMPSIKSMNEQDQHDDNTPPSTTSNTILTTSTMTSSSTTLPSTDHSQFIPPSINTPSSDYLVTLTHTSSPSIIENEFTNILRIHSNYPSVLSPRSTSSSHYTFTSRFHINGTFRDTILFRETDDTFISFPHTVITIPPTNLTFFWKQYESYKNTHNILIDSRLQILIMYAALAYADELLVYNSYKMKIVNIYDYCSDLFKISASELNITQIQELFIIKLFISYYLQKCDIGWRINQVISNLKELHRYQTTELQNKTIIDILMNYIKCPSIESFNKNNVSIMFKLINDYFGNNAFKYVDTYDLIVGPWNLQNLKIEDVYIELMLLKHSHFIFAKNDNM